MSFRPTHLACLLLLLSSFAVSDARTGSVTPSRTPSGVFARKLLLRAAVQETQTARPNLGRELPTRFTAVTIPVQSVMHWVLGPAEHTAHVHAVTGSSL